MHICQEYIDFYFLLFPFIQTANDVTFAARIRDVVVCPRMLIGQERYEYSSLNGILSREYIFAQAMARFHGNVNLFILVRGKYV